jgi:hypothetical protein
LTIHAGAGADDCMDSLHANGVTNIVVVENGDAGIDAAGSRVNTWCSSNRAQNLGYGRGVNRGAAATPAGATCWSPIPIW